MRKKTTASAHVDWYETHAWTFKWNFLPTEICHKTIARYTFAWFKLEHESHASFDRVGVCDVCEPLRLKCSLSISATQPNRSIIGARANGTNGMTQWTEQRRQWTASVARRRRRWQWRWPHIVWQACLVGHTEQQTTIETMATTTHQCTHVLQVNELHVWMAGGRRPTGKVLLIEIDFELPLPPRQLFLFFHFHRWGNVTILNFVRRRRLRQPAQRGYDSVQFNRIIPCWC